jgi:hypothetical protein
VTNPVDLSPDLQEWIRLSGLSMTQGSQTDDGRTVLWNKGGEVRYFINIIDDWYVITSSDRMSAESYEFAGASMAVIEKYLYGDRGWLIRRMKDLPRIRRPFEAVELRRGYSIGKMTFQDRERSTLLNDAGMVVAIAGIGDLVELSNYIDVPVDVIKNSFLDPQGKPLFSPWKELER